jgi:methylated-DNA-[protein]-cysteine S-methyltransferase
MQGSHFAERVREVVRHIPKGSVRTYGEVAAAVGHPGAARAVGTVMKHNFDNSVPCHRVVKAGGKVGAYNRGGEERKRELLRSEGVML